MSKFSIIIALVLAGKLLNAQARIIHVFVALCDNKYQGIVPVPEKIGNGQDPKNNLYWGCGYGAKSFFIKHSTDWTLLKTQKDPKNISWNVLYLNTKQKTVIWLPMLTTGNS